MTHWMELLVDEELRDVVKELIGLQIKEPLYNPFAGGADWTDALRESPHCATFRLFDGRIAKVTFWLAVNPDIGLPYENPVIIDPERIIIVIGGDEECSYQKCT